MNKGGQFFLIAALVIAGIVITLAAINITTKTASTEAAIFDLSNEIDYESNQLINYEVYKDVPQQQKAQFLNTLMRNYSFSNPGTDMLFVYGNDKAATGIFYGEEPTGFAGLNTGGESIILRTVAIEPSNLDTSVMGAGDKKKIRVMLNATIFLEFDLSPGENFFIVLRKEVGGETLVSREE